MPAPTNTLLTVCQTNRVLGGDLGAILKYTMATGDSVTFPNTGKEFLIVLTEGSVDTTVTVPLIATLDNRTATSKSYVVLASKVYLIGPFPPSLYNDANGNVTATITYSGPTGVNTGIGAARLIAEPI